MTIVVGKSSQQVALSDLRKVTYSGDNMVVTLRDGNTSNFAMADVTSVTLQNVPTPTQDVDQVTGEQETKTRKVVINGVIYIEKDGERFSLLGTKL